MGLRAQKRCDGHWATDRPSQPRPTHRGRCASSKPFRSFKNDAAQESIGRDRRGNTTVETEDGDTTVETEDVWELLWTKFRETRPFDPKVIQTQHNEICVCTSFTYAFVRMTHNACSPKFIGIPTGFRK